MQLCTLTCVYTPTYTSHLCTHLHILTCVPHLYTTCSTWQSPSLHSLPCVHPYSSRLQFPRKYEQDKEVQPLETWGFLLLFEKLGMKQILALHCPLLANLRNLN